MAKGKKGGKGRRHGDSESDEEQEAGNTNEALGTSPPVDTSKMGFAERRQFKQQQAADKRRLKMKCHLCGQEGHVRRECPGFADDGAGESKYKNSNGDTGSQWNTKKGAKNRGRNTKNTAALQAAEELGVDLPPGFMAPLEEKSKVVVKQEGGGGDEKEGEEPQAGAHTPFLYYDTSCDVVAILDHLRSGRGKAKKLSAQEAMKEYQQVPLVVVEDHDEEDLPPPVATFGGCLSRSMMKPNRPWLAPPQVEAIISECHPIWHIVGLGTDFLAQDDGSSDATDPESPSTLAIGALAETISSNSGSIVGLFADLNYDPKFVTRSGCDRPAQLRRLRATLAAATHSTLSHCLTVQIRLSPGAPTESSHHHDKDDPYKQAIEDLTSVLTEVLPQNKDLKVHLSCWSGTPTDMNQLVQAFGTGAPQQQPQSQLFIGMDATVTFAKAAGIHECAFDVNPTTNLVLETGRPFTIPSNITRSMGRDAFGHPAHSIPWIAHGMAQHTSPMHNATAATAAKAADESDTSGGIDALAIARAASTNTVLLYPGIQK